MFYIQILCAGQKRKNTAEFSIMERKRSPSENFAGTISQISMTVVVRLSLSLFLSLSRAYDLLEI